MSAVYDDVKKKAMYRQAGGFATMHGEPVDAVAGTIPEYSSSSLGQYVGSAFLTGAVVIYALHGDLHDMGERTQILPVRGGRIFPLLGHTRTSTMSMGRAWVASEAEVYNSGVVHLPWTRKVIFSGKVQFRTAQLLRRTPRTIVSDFLTDEGNG